MRLTDLPHKPQGKKDYRSLREKYPARRQPLASGGNMNIKRAIIIILDSVGAGELPDAARFGDTGSDTLGNLARSQGGLKLPTMQNLGLGNLHAIAGVPPAASPAGFYGKMAEQSPAKDTIIGHWEIAGVISRQAFPTYPDGFPEEILKPFKDQIHRDILGNIAASGTEIIKDLGAEHLRTGFPIVYTSADSVFQIAAHVDIIPLEELYGMCLIARDILQGPYAMSRVIARPFTGSPGNFTRTDQRRDFSLPPPGKTLLDLISDSGGKVCALGKIEDIFAGQGVSLAWHTHNNLDGLNLTLQVMREHTDAKLIFTNLVDFDMLYGHRNNEAGYKTALEEFDAFLPEILQALQPEDVLVITADHGCDPTIKTSTDHSREYVPLLVYGKSLSRPKNLGTRTSYADVGKTLQELLQVQGSLEGVSFAADLLAGQS